MQSSPFRLKPNQLPFRKRTWLTAADYALPLLVLALTQTTVLNVFSELFFLSQRFTKGLPQVQEGKNSPKSFQGQGGTFNYSALTCLLSVCLSLEQADWAQGSPEVSIHTAWPWRMTEARSQQVSTMKNREGDVTAWAFSYEKKKTWLKTACCFFWLKLW